MTQPAEMADLSISRFKAIMDRQKTALEALKNGIDQSYIDAVSLIHQNRGRLVITGIGKSGHVGVKIAASFASTGTPAYFVHATEAAHGDLGMITVEDVVMLISNSGTTKELFPVLDYCEAHQIPTIGLTMRADSRLAREVSVPVVMPDVKEICPNELAPTTSTLMTMAIGDAMTVLLVEMRRFSSLDFARFHPGGKLGMQLVTVGRYIDGHELNAPFLPADAAMTDIITAVTEGKMGCAVVVDADNALLGIITEGDLRRAYGPEMFEMTAEQIMTRDPKTVTRGTLLREAADMMKRTRIANLVVVDGNRALDAIHMKDLMQEGYV